MRLVAFMKISVFSDFVYFTIIRRQNTLKIQTINNIQLRLKAYFLQNDLFACSISLPHSTIFISRSVDFNFVDTDSKPIDEGTKIQWKQCAADTLIDQLVK